VAAGADLRLLPLALGDGVTAAVTTRHGGVSEGPYATLNLSYSVGDDPAAVAENRRRVGAALGAETVTWAQQQHTVMVAVVDDALAGTGHDGPDGPVGVPATDALVTDRPGVALAAMAADCAQVVLWDPVHRAVGVAHAGRLGVQGGIVPAALAAMADAYGTRPADVRVGIGPHIAAASYEVGPAEVAEAKAALGELAVVTPTRDGRGCLDLRAGILGQLERAGVPRGAVVTVDHDTRTTTELLYSHRAERPTGRFALVAVIRARR